MEKQVFKGLYSEIVKANPRTDAERAMSHFDIKEEDWKKLSEKEQKEYIAKLPIRGSAKKQDSKPNNAVLRNKSANITAARNGLFVNISEDWHYKADDGKLDYIWISKPFIAKDMDEVKKLLEEEFVKNIKEMDYKELKNVANSNYGPLLAKRDTLIKRNMAFATEEGDGHIHLAFGNIIDKKVNNEIKKFFVGETLPDKVYMNLESGLKSYTGKQIDEVVSTLKSHVHKFEIELDDTDKDRSRVFGETTKSGEHFHKVHLIDIVSTPVSNTPDKA